MHAMASAPWAERHPVHNAACSVDAAPLAALLNARALAGAALDVVDEEGRSALHYAAWNGLQATAEVLLRHNASVDVRTTDRGSTPLHFAAGMGKLACVKLLLSYGADTTLRDIDKWTPLDLAKQDLMASEDTGAICEALLAAQAAQAAAQT